VTVGASVGVDCSHDNLKNSIDLWNGYKYTEVYIYRVLELLPVCHLSTHPLTVHRSRTRGVRCPIFHLIHSCTTVVFPPLCGFTAEHLEGYPETAG